MQEITTPHALSQEPFHVARNDDEVRKLCINSYRLMKEITTPHYFAQEPCIRLVMTMSSIVRLPLSLERG